MRVQATGGTGMSEGREVVKGHVHGTSQQMQDWWGRVNVPTCESESHKGWAHLVGGVGTGWGKDVSEEREWRKVTYLEIKWWGQVNAHTCERVGGKLGTPCWRCRQLGKGHEQGKKVAKGHVPHNRCRTVGASECTHARDRKAGPGCTQK